MAHVQFQSSNVCTRSNFGTCDDVFDKVTNHVFEKAYELNEETNAESFISECKALGSYLNDNKSDCNQCYGRIYHGRTNIDAAVKIYLDKVTKFGGCPHPFKSEDAERIKLISDIEKFCEEKKGHIKEIKQLKGKCDAKKECSNSEPYKTKCSTYLEWLDERKTYFLGKKEQITHLKKKRNPQIKLPLNCDVTDTATFENKEDICHEIKSEESEFGEIFLDGYAVDDIFDENIRLITLLPSSTGDLKYITVPNSFNNESDQTDNPLQSGNSINSETPRYERYYKIPEPTLTGSPIPQTFRKTLPTQKTLPPQKQLPYQENLTPEESPSLGLFYNKHELFLPLPEFRSSTSYK
ncbi:hypothetical protein PVIIG_01825 [Plasmodium vivax India VII]|uniref:VIR protein n=1 Tax=Plasmodium vivax India VII TaxID=1077284 RepID=A0A0J9SAR8_PLAVI|nr:hypothetical protein PVIIG_01825 [Plasmodium vivax India VII]